jgi:ribosomal protein L35
MKTNKSYSKRIKVTKNGKLIARRAGQNHFNAKESGRTQMKKGRTQSIVMTQRDKRRYFGTSTI